MAVAPAAGEDEGDRLVIVCWPDTTHTSPGWIGVHRLADDGSFEEAASYEVGRQAGKLLVADLDQDGIDDILVANTGGQQEQHHLSFLKGLDDGAFAEPARFPPVSSAFVLNDVNGNGHLDMVIPEENAALMAENIAEGAFRRDGLPGIRARERSAGVVGGLSGHERFGVIADYEAETIFVLPGGGAGYSEVPFPEAPGPVHSVLAVGDINGNDRMDLIVAVQAADSIERTVHLLLGDDDGGWSLSEPIEEITAFPQEVALAPEQRGTFIHAFVSPWADPQEDRDFVDHVAIGADGEASTRGTIPLSHYPYSMVVGDFVGDGEAELVIRDMDGQRVTRISLVQFEQG